MVPSKEKNKTKIKKKKKWGEGKKKKANIIPLSKPDVNNSSSGCRFSLKAVPLKSYV